MICLLAPPLLFAQEDDCFVHFHSVGSSPFSFHGIFSSLGSPQGDNMDGALPSRSPLEAAMSEQQAPTPQKQSVGQVSVDIYEQDNYYIIKAPIAGVRLSDIDLEISDNTITIRGSRQQGDAIPGEHYYLQECFWGDFERRVTLPCTIDPRKVKATFNKECILKILVPKEEKVKIVRINE